MTAEQFKIKVIEAGIRSVEQHEDREYRRRGCLLGFEICYQLNTPEDFLRVLEQRHVVEREMVRVTGLEGAARQRAVEAYWEYHCATAQIEHVWERMKIAWRLPGPYSGRALMQYAQIVGMKEDSWTMS